MLHNHTSFIYRRRYAVYQLTSVVKHTNCEADCRKTTASLQAYARGGGNIKLGVCGGGGVTYRVNKLDPLH